MNKNGGKRKGSGPKKGSRTGTRNRRLMARVKEILNQPNIEAKLARVEARMLAERKLGANDMIYPAPDKVLNQKSMFKSI